MVLNYEWCKDFFRQRLLLQTINIKNHYIGWIEKFDSILRFESGEFWSAIEIIYVETYKKESHYLLKNDLKRKRIICIEK